MQYVLKALHMGRRPLWNAQRRLCAVQLFLYDDPEVVPDSAHLLHLLEGMRRPTSPRLLLSPQSPALLQALLAHARASDCYAVEVRGAWLADSEDLLRLSEIAHAQGVRLIWRGAIAQLPAAEIAQLFTGSLLHMEPQQALELMRVPLHEQVPAHLRLLRGQMYEDVYSQIIARRCLDQYDAAALAGWPDEDVLYRLRLSGSLQPSREHVGDLIRAVQANQSLDSFEAILSHDPLLAWRLMHHVNFEAKGARGNIDSLRHALVMLGFEPLERWLQQQQQTASDEPDLQPVRQGMVMRAQLTAHMLETGISEELRSEIYLCGLFSRMDQLLGEPLQQCLAQLPLSSRIAQAHLEQDGPYASAVLMAEAMEREDAADDIRALSAEFEFDPERTNRVLLRHIMAWDAHPPAWW